MKKTLFGVIASLFLVAACSSSEAPDTAAESRVASLDDVELIPRRAFFGDPELWQGRISPDGTRVSYIAPVDGITNLFVAPIDDVTAGTQVTNDTRGINNHAWAYNDNDLLYFRDSGGDENFHIVRVNLETGEEIDLTPYENTLGIIVGGSYRHPDTMLIGMNDRDPRWHDVYRVDLRTGERELVELNDGFGSYLADHDLQLKLAVKPAAAGAQDIFKKGEDGEWVKFMHIAREDAFSVQNFGFSSDGSSVYMTLSEGRDKGALYEVDYATGEMTMLGESEFADVGSALIDASTHEPLAYSVNRMSTEWHAIDEGVAEVFANVAAEVPGDLQILAQDRSAQRWIAAIDAPDAPTAYYVINRADGSVEKLFDTYMQLIGKPLTDTYPLVIKSRDGLDLVSYLTLPPHLDLNGEQGLDEPVPMVLWVHGGPWARDTHGYSAVSQWFANRGYAVLKVNFRGSTGFGKAFTNAGEREWAAAMHNDLIDAVDWSIARGITEPGRIAIGGGSYGGYATLVGLTYTPETFACGVDIVGPSNLVTLLNSVPEYWASFFELLVTHVGDPRTEEGQRFLRSRSPLHKADEITKPLLIGQGANDPRVKQAESDQIVAAMQENDLPVTYVLFPDEGHGFARAENNDSFFAITEVFLAECLGGRAEDFGDAFAGSSTTVPHGVEYIPGLAEALAEVEIVEKF